MSKLIPYFVSKDARAQAEFYAQALGGEIQSVMTHGQMEGAPEESKDKVLHLCVQAGGHTFFLSDSVYQALEHGNSISINLEFDNEAEARDAFDKLAEGGSISHPLELAFWGSLFGQLRDPYGVQWIITGAVQAPQA